MDRDQDNSFEKSHQLSLQQTDDAVSPHELTAILNTNSIRYVLIGGHVLGYLTGSPRATIDVDVLVSSAQVAKASPRRKLGGPQAAAPVSLSVSLLIA